VKIPHYILCILRKHRLRLAVFFAAASFLIFIDEAVKEGYGFDIVDLVNLQVTHEKLFVVFLVLALVFGARKRG